MLSSLSSTIITVLAIARSRHPCSVNGCGARGGYRRRWGDFVNNVGGKYYGKENIKDRVQGFHTVRNSMVDEGSDAYGKPGMWVRTHNFRTLFMARLIEQLTEAKIRTIVNDGLHPDGLGLYLQIRPSGRSWIFRFTLNKRTRDMGLGSFADVSLMSARAAAAEKRALVAKGIDPIEHAKNARISGASKPDGLTFEQAAEQYMKTRLGNFATKCRRSLKPLAFAAMFVCAASVGARFA